MKFHFGTETSDKQSHTRPQKQNVLLTNMVRILVGNKGYDFF